ncbi:MAG: SDR family oxidoreductase, partial [Cyanobacteria bacterium J06649_4]
MTQLSTKESPKTALITGASSGIGKAFAQVLAREQHNLVVVARSEEKLNALKEELSQQYGIIVTVIVKDLTEENAAQQIVDTLKQQNISVDVLINNAGFGDYSRFAESDWQKQENMILLNVLALSHLTRLCLPGMLARGQGQILNVASTAAFQPGPMMSVYFASKAYVLSFSEAIAAETEGKGISVTVLCPGPTQSNFGETANMDKIPGMGNVTSDKFPTALTVAQYGYDKLQQGKVVAVHGVLNKFLTFTPRIM